jgi:NAD-dependent DNA ligase
VFDATCLITDEDYDRYNRELNDLERDYPEIASKVEFADISPNRVVGSSDVSDYPLDIVRTAEYLMNRAKEKR